MNDFEKILTGGGMVFKGVRVGELFLECGC